MDEIDIEDIFVDREKALKYLDDELKKRNDRVKEYAIRITQAPGTGKTRLLKEFIKKVEDEGKGIGIYLLSSDFEEWAHGDLNSLKRKFLRATLVNVISEIKDRDEISFGYAKQLVKKHNLDYWAYKDLLGILNIDKPFRFLFRDFCKVVLPSINKLLVVVIDEIQATIGIMTEQFQNAKGQGLFREIIKMAADLIKIPNVLVILSGTNYKIMHYLETFGSPLKQKTMEYKLEPLKPEYVGEFYDRVFGSPQDEVSKTLRDWLIINSNGVPRTMVWMVDALQRHGGIEWANKIGVRKAIDELNSEILDIVIEDVKASVKDLIHLKNGQEVLEWLAFRTLFDRVIPLVEADSKVRTPEEEKDICSVEDLVNKGLIHLLNGSFEIRNVYFEKALRDVLEIKKYTLQSLLDLMNIAETEVDKLSGLLSWHRNILGAYLEIAVALGLYNMSKILGYVDLSSLLDRPMEHETKIKVEKIIRIPSIDMLIKSKKIEPNVIYAAPERGPDLTIFTEDKHVIIIECKNWQRKLTRPEADEIFDKLIEYGELFKDYTPIHILVTAKSQDQRIYEKAIQRGIFIISDDKLKKIIGEKVYELFADIRQKAAKARIITVDIK